MNKKLSKFKSCYVPAIILCAVVSLSLCLTGCGMFDASITAQKRSDLAKLRYPDDVNNEVNKDIVVVRNKDEINLVNRTAHIYTNMQLWLNKQYVHKIKRISIGTDNHLYLSTFVNRYRKSFPVGKFLAPDKADDLVLAELYNPKSKKMYRLFVLDPLKIDDAAKSRGQKLEDMH